MEIFKKDSNVFSILTEAVSEAIIVVNDEQKIVASNFSASTLFQYVKEDLTGQHINLLIPSKYHHAHKHHVEEFQKNSAKRQMGHSRDIFGLKKDGTQFPVEAGLNPFSIYGNNYVMVLITDITIRKRAELEILDLNAHLEKKVEERTKRLQEALHKEKELNDLKTKFLSLVSHEFRTPLTGIYTSATLIGKYKEAEQQEKRDKHIKTIKSKVKFLNNIITDFLSIERLESGKENYKFTTFALSKPINEVVYEANMVLKEGQKILYPENIDHINLNFDEKIVELILTNLVNNAIKYSLENSTIKIIAQIENEDLVLEISDEGIGIPSEEQKFIFNRYFRAENALLDQGTGIGLNIAKTHLENLGGTINFKSEEGKGSTFKVQIPLKQNK